LRGFEYALEREFHVLHRDELDHLYHLVFGEMKFAPQRISKLPL